MIKALVICTCKDKGNTSALTDYLNLLKISTQLKTNFDDALDYLDKNKVELVFLEPITETLEGDDKKKFITKLNVDEGLLYAKIIRLFSRICG